MMHTVAYSVLTGAGSTNLDMPAVTDTVLTTRNNHLIFTDPFMLLYAWASGATMTRMRANIPTLNAFFRHQIWPLDTSATVPDRPALVDYASYPIPLPMNEEIAWETTETGAAEQDTLLLWLATPDHTFNLPTGIARLTARATYSITPAAAFTWSGASAFTFAENLRGGWYTVVGFQVFDASVLAARLIFPRAKSYHGRILRPGTLVQNATGNRPDRRFDGNTGVFGAFHSFEPVQVEILAVTAAAHTGECRLDLIFHDDTVPPAAGGVGVGNYGVGV